MKKLLFIVILLCLFINIDVFAATTEVISCGNIKDIPAKIPEITRLAMNILKIVAPILIVIFGSIDFLKAITSQKESEISDGLNKFIKRLIMGMCVFITLAVVQLALSTFTNNTSISGCVSCFLSTDNNCNHYQIEK